ncbi:MAG TPA: PA14 domain-containing protein, partial [Candidatus Limnocylindria bacterium]|nr:PA14 domain-containing protein [Candidatus Limnocylindria bacterium]
MRSASLTKFLAATLVIATFSWAAQAQFTPVDIRAPAGAGSTITNGPGSYTITGGGDEMWGDYDQGHFAYYVQTGDFDVRVRAVSITPANRWSKAGIRLAESLDPATMAIQTYVSPVGPTPLPADNPNGVNTHNTFWRTGNPLHGGVTGGQHETVGAAPAYPNAWMRMTRSSNTVVTYSGNNGINWTVIQAFDMNVTNDPATAFTNVIPTTALLGFAISSHNNVAPLTATAEFRDFGSPSNAIELTLQPVSQSKFVNQTATFAAGVAGGYDFAALQWRTNGVAIPGATFPTYTTPALLTTDNGLVYTLFASNTVNGTVATSSAATLTVNPNPQLVDISSRNDLAGHIYVTYTKAMGPTAIDPLKYSVSGGVVVSGASFFGSGDTVVRLDVSALTVGSSYTVTVTGVLDASANPLVPNPDNRTFTHFAGLNPAVGLSMKRFDGSADFNVLLNKIATCAAPQRQSTNMADFEYTTSEAADVPGGNLFGDAGTDNYGMWVYGQFVPPVTGNYQFGFSSDDHGELFLSTDSAPANKVLITSIPAWNGYRRYVTQADPGSSVPTLSASIPLVAGRTYYMEGMAAEGSGGDHIAVTVRKP